MADKTFFFEPDVHELNQATQSVIGVALRNIFPSTYPRSPTHPALLQRMSLLLFSWFQVYVPCQDLTPTFSFSRNLCFILD